MWARNYGANGFFVHDSNPDGPDSNGKIDCNDYRFENVIASFNRAYGVYAFGCAGGRITKSVGYGHGDSAFYIGATPIQKKPKTTPGSITSTATRTCSATRAPTRATS